MALELDLSKPYFLKSKVYHSRKHEIDHAFKYSTLNVFCDVSNVAELNSYFQKHFFKTLQIRSEDYFSGEKEICLETKIRSWIFDRFHLKFEQILLQTMPSFLGYVFNPISFWYCYDNKILKGVLCDVNNTFGEKFFYWIYAGGQDLLSKKIEQDKKFHVSPFFSTDGIYQFSFHQKHSLVLSEVTLLTEDRKLKIKTWISGELSGLESLNFFGLIRAYGFFTVLVILRIHYQALRLFFKKATFFRKPQYPNQEVQNESTIIDR